jgi:hypothetical protein
VIASHYAEPVERKVGAAATLRSSPSADSETLEGLQAGDVFLMLDESLGWAWGYAGRDRRVGYVPAASLASVKHGKL